MLSKWTITKAEVGNEMEIFITLNEYNLANSLKKVPTGNGDYLA